jgi:hypothetical protein
MRSRPRDLGTKMESRIVAAAQAAGLIAERLAEGGSADRGDVRIWTDTEWVIESKDRERLNIHQELEKALLKSGTADTAVVWRRMTRAAGNTRRHQDGPVIVAITLDRFLQLLGEST